jgi:hypothetical protein
LGNTFIAVLNAPAAYLGQCLGEIWISYTVALRKPRITVSENYLMPRIVACASTTASALAPFGYINDGEMRLSTKATLPVDLIRPESALDYLPISAPGAFIDDLTLDVPTAYPNVAVPQFIAVAFPAWYSGICEIRLQIWFRSPVNLSNTMNVAGQGQISRFYDIPWNLYQSSSTNAAWTHYTSNPCPQVGSVVLDAVECTLHVRVQPSLNGVTNIIYFGMRNSPVPTSCYMAQITVNGINTSLSLNDAAQGSNAAIKGGSRLVLDNADNLGTPALWP